VHEAGAHRAPDDALDQRLDARPDGHEVGADRPRLVEDDPSRVAVPLDAARAHTVLRETLSRVGELACMLLDLDRVERLGPEGGDALGTTLTTVTAVASEASSAVRSSARRAGSEPS
jgi:hypothetical protein